MLSNGASYESQDYLLDFTKRIAAKYQDDTRSNEFIPALFGIKVPNLFTGDTSEPTEKADLIRDKFSKFLKEYIQTNILHKNLIKKLKDMLSSTVRIRKQNEFQWIILNVIKFVS